MKSVKNGLSGIVVGLIFFAIGIESAGKAGASTTSLETHKISRRRQNEISDPGLISKSVSFRIDPFVSDKIIWLRARRTASMPV